MTSSQLRPNPPSVLLLPFTPPAWHQTHLNISIFLSGNVSVGCYKTGGPLTTDSFPLSAEIPKKTPQKNSSFTTPVPLHSTTYGSTSVLCVCVCVCDSQTTVRPRPLRAWTAANQSYVWQLVTPRPMQPDSQSALWWPVWVNVEDQKFKLIIN